MALVKRLVKDAPLTFAEGDANLDYLYGLSTNTGSFIKESQTGSFVRDSQTGSFVRNSQTGSFITTGSDSVTQGITGSLSVSGSNSFVESHGGFFAYDSEIIARDYTNNNNAYISAEDGTSTRYARIAYNVGLGPHLTISTGYSTAGRIASNPNWTGYHEYILPDVSGEFLVNKGTLKVTGSLTISGSFAVTGSTSVSGSLSVTGSITTQLINAADDTAAAAAGVPVGGLYRSGNFVLIRLS